MVSWKWIVRGTQDSSSPGAMERPWEETGTVDAEIAGEVVEWFAAHGPWDGLDQDRAITLEITPVWAPTEQETP